MQETVVGNWPQHYCMAEYGFICQAWLLAGAVNRDGPPLLVDGLLGGLVDGLAVLCQSPDRKDVAVVGVGDHAVAVEDPADVLLGPVPILFLRADQKGCPGINGCWVYLI